MGALEEPLKHILTTIKMEDETRKTTIKHLEELLKKFILVLKHTDPLFEALYQEIFYGGSYYDNLKVGLPVDFDLELRLNLPKLTTPTIHYEDSPGFVTTELTGFNIFRRNGDQFAKYPDLKRKLLDDDYFLDSRKTIRWMQSIVDKALFRFTYLNFNISRKMSESTVTLKIKAYPYEEIYFYIDLVPCFVFDGTKWPNNFKKPAYFNNFVVEKRFSILPNSTDSKLWSLSFQLQERRMLQSKTEHLRSGIRLIKYLIRDVYNFKCISSYCIKTIGLWEIENRLFFYWNNATLSEVFLNLLINLHENVQQGVIKHYWNEELNLIEHVSLGNFSMFLQHTIKKLKNATEDDEVYNIFKTECPRPLSLSTFDSADIAASVAGVVEVGIGLFAAYKFLSNLSNRRSSDSDEQ